MTGREQAKEEVFRYLGRRGQEVPEALEEMVEACMTEMAQAARPRFVTGQYDIKKTEQGLLLEGAGLTLPGANIARHLSGCQEAILLAATLGVEADGLIRRWEPVDLTRSLVLDACATQQIEALCDQGEEELRAEAAKEGKQATGRYSPGYGDLPLSLQPKVLVALDAGRRIGLTCTDRWILLPRKSVTAVIGRGEGMAPRAKGCENCPMGVSCPYRKEKQTGGCERVSKGSYPAV